MTAQLGKAARTTLHQLLRNPKRVPNCVTYPSSVRSFSVLFPNFDVSANDNDNRRQKKKGGKPSYRFVDRIRVRASAGEGGKGSLSMQALKRKRKLKPDGGHGGNGGSVIVFADPHEQSLRMSRHHVQADSGTNGSSQDKYGRKGKNTIVRVPCGVVVKQVLGYDEIWDPETQTVKKINENEDDDPEFWDFEENYSNSEEEETDDEEEDSKGYKLHDTREIGFEELDDGTWNDDDDDDDNLQYADREKVVLADLDKPSSHIVVARGGRGGYGTSMWSSHHGKLPDARILAKYARPKPGETVYLELELKLIADIGLVGFPNAGKSSLLCAMSRAGPRVAPYPFTTLNPFVGVIEYQDAFTLKVADIPGLIDGASEGRGKGHDFLRHLERTKALLYIVDAAGTECRDPVEDLKILANELASYGDGDMMNRNALVVANKLDLLDEEEQTDILSSLEEAAHEMGIQVYGNALGISAGVTGLGLGPLSEVMRSIVLQSQSES